jgi:hypothetical protein
VGDQGTRWWLLNQAAKSSMGSALSGPPGDGLQRPFGVPGREPHGLGVRRVLVALDLRAAVKRRPSFSATSSVVIAAVLLT